MEHVKYLILGAGPTGLSLAYSLLQAGEKSFVVLEKEAEPGGLCRSAQVDGAPLDIGGGHFLDTRSRDVVNSLFRFLPEDEWNRFDRKSTIRVHDTEIDYPFEAHLWQFPVDMQVDYLQSVARAGCNTGQPMPEEFSAWIRWKLGDRIAEDYMLPYNRKIWSIDLDRLGTYWLHKLPNVSLRETLYSCLKQKRAGKMPAHAEFYYPKKFGYGEVWRRMGEELGARLLVNEPVEKIEIGEKRINESIEGEYIINTIPWTEWLQSAVDLPQKVRTEIEKLQFSSVEIAYEAGSNNDPAQWTYIPDESTAYHRLLNRYNFCPGARGHWTETNGRRLSGACGQALSEEGMEKKRNSEPLESGNGWSYLNKHAYPLNTIDKPQVMRRIIDWAQSQQIIGVGRWGEWEHMNSDVAVAKGISTAQKIMS